MRDRWTLDDLVALGEVVEAHFVFLASGMRDASREELGNRVKATRDWYSRLALVIRELATTQATEGALADCTFNGQAPLATGPEGEPMTPEGGRRERTSGLVETAPARHRLYQLIGGMNAGWRLAFPDDAAAIWYATAGNGKYPMLYESKALEVPPMPVGLRVWGYYRLDRDAGVALWNAVRQLPATRGVVN